MLTGLRLSPNAFRDVVRKHKRKVGTTIRYSLNEAARVTFSVRESLPGRRGRGGRCVKPTHSNRHAKRCRRTVTLGTFAAQGSGGADHLRFSGKVGGHRLKPGAYTLVPAPLAAGVAGKPQSAGFRIVA